jgi:trk system potassium uptake protein TrkH
MFVGGLGFMTLATFLLIILGQKVSLAQRLLMKENLGVNQLGGLAHLTVRVVIFATVIQVLGFIALTIRFSFIYEIPEAIWQAAFLSVSSFNNAGFVVLRYSDSLAAFITDYSVLIIMGVLILIGGISYWVVADIVKVRRWSLLSLNTKLVLIMTALLLYAGALVFFFSEYDNSGTLASLPVLDKAVVSSFQSVSARTAGFAIVNFGNTQQHTNFFYIALMFIGAASASTAGGVKVNTLAIVLISVISSLKGKNHPAIFGREIPIGQLQRAMAILVIAVIFVFLIALMLVFFEQGFPFSALLFETVSAFGTVGLSTGITGELSACGQVILVLTMCFGKLGPLTLALTMALRRDSDAYRFSQERVTIG